MNRPPGSRRLSAALLGTALAVAGCTGGESASAPASSTPPTPAASTPAPSVAGSAAPSPLVTSACDRVDSVTLAVAGGPQARYAGYFAALDGGYAEDCLQVAVIDAGTDPITAVGEGRADFAVAPLADGLSARERGATLVNVAQVFQRSGDVQISRADAGITDIAGLKGKRLTIDPGSSGLSAMAAIAAAGLDPVGDMTIVDAAPDALLADDVASVQGTTYDTLPQLVQASGGSEADFSVISYQDLGVGLLPDGIWTSQDVLADPVFQDLTQRLVTASLRGWIQCRDDVASCAHAVSSAGGPSPDGALQWRINKVNSLVWPSPSGVGVMDPALFDSTVNVLVNTKSPAGVQGLGAAPADGSWTDQYARAADGSLAEAGLNVTGDGYVPPDIPLS